MMRNIKFFVIGLVVVLGLVCCKHQEPIGTSSAAISIGPAIDNSEYELVNRQILVHGVGKSKSQQLSRTKSRTAAFKEADSTLRNIVSDICGDRHFEEPEYGELVFANTRTDSEKTVMYANDKGHNVYECRLSLQVEIEPTLKAIYDRMNVETDYSYYMFLRDVDHRLNLINALKKQFEDE